MNSRWRLAIVLAGVAGVLLATAGSFAYAQSTTQQNSQANCFSGTNGSGGMGMMGDMNHYGYMNRGQCEDQTGLGMRQCQDFMMQGENLRPCS